MKPCTRLRSKDMIIRGGENIQPREIEDVLVGDPAVLDAAVIGAPEQKWGEVVIDYVATRPGSALDTISKNPVGKIVMATSEEDATR